MDVVYVSRSMHNAPESPTSAHDSNSRNTTYLLDPTEFPCFPLGRGRLEQRNDNSVCCLERVRKRYATVASFGTYVSNPVLPLSVAIRQQNACLDINSAPTNTSAALLVGAGDFVVGPFSGMPRSYSSSDSTPTRGYRDVLLFLALEDIERYSSVQTQLPTGRRLRFFVGMAHIKSSMIGKHLEATTTQVEVSTEITKAHVMITPLTTASQSSFVCDVSVSLRQVEHLNIVSFNNALPNTRRNSKFATIILAVPDSVTIRGSINVIPGLSLVVGVGYSRSHSQELTYPCEEVYLNAIKPDIDTLLQEQSWCAALDAICVAQVPGTGSLSGNAGEIQFTMPLPDAAWDDYLIRSRDAFMPTYIFIDFTLIVHDKISGKRIVSNLKTQTQLKNTNILRQCKQQQLATSIEDMIEIDILLGLAGNASSFASSVVQNLDVTRRQRPDNVSVTRPSAALLQRDVSSKESNVMTLLLKGNPQLFEKNYAQEFTLAVEDIISLHFLNDHKLALVQQLIADGGAFTTENVLFDNSESRTVMQLMPTKALLAYCPFHAQRGVFGCNARREIRQRVLEFQTNSITSLTSRVREDAESAHIRAGLWSRDLLGGSEYARQLGYNHSKLVHRQN